MATVLLVRHGRTTANATVLLLTSAGEDVADGLEDAADDAHAALAAVGGLTLRWTPLPRDPSQ